MCIKTAALWDVTTYSARQVPMLLANLLPSSPGWKSKREDKVSMALKCRYLATKQYGGTSQQTNINFMSVYRCKFCCKMLAFINVCMPNAVGIGRERGAVRRSLKAVIQKWTAFD